MRFRPITAPCYTTLKDALGVPCFFLLRCRCMNPSLSPCEPTIGAFNQRPYSICPAWSGPPNPMCCTPAQDIHHHDAPPTRARSLEQETSWTNAFIATIHYPLCKSLQLASTATRHLRLAQSQTQSSPQPRDWLATSASNWCPTKKHAWLSIQLSTALSRTSFLSFASM